MGMLLSWAGLALLSSSVAAFIWRFAPVLTILAGGLFLGERLALRELTPASLMIAGAVVTALGQWELVGGGVILTLLACCLAAVQGLMAKTAVETIHPNVVVFYRVALGVVSIGLWAVAAGKLDFGVAASYWLVTLLGAFLGPCASFLLRYRALRCWPLSRSALVMTVQPLFVLPMEYLTSRELPTGRELLGGFLLLGGALWFAWIHFDGKKAR
jgi:drug/metabolite transporter (DMT)-like permease